MEKGKFIGRLAAGQDQEIIIALEKVTGLRCCSQRSNYVEGFHTIVLSEENSESCIQYYVETAPNNELLFFAPKGIGEMRSYLKKKFKQAKDEICLLYTSPSPRDQRGSRMPSSA